VLAPLAPHLAEDAWQSLPWAPPAASVFQAGWFAPPDAWRGAAADAPVSYGALLALRCAPAPLLRPRRRVALPAGAIPPPAPAERGARAGAR
jgi:isoleucyl-tRNA synthetase